MKDQHYKYYSDHYRHFGPLETKSGIRGEVKELMYCMLDPDPDERVSIGGILGKEWVKGIGSCVRDNGVLVDSPVPHTH